MHAISAISVSRTEIVIAEGNDVVVFSQVAAVGQHGSHADAQREECMAQRLENARRGQAFGVETKYEVERLAETVHCESVHQQDQHQSEQDRHQDAGPSLDSFVNATPDDPDRNDHKKNVPKQVETARSEQCAKHGLDTLRTQARNLA